MANAEQMRAAVDRYTALWTAGDQEAWLDLFAPGATIEDPVGSEVRVGREGLVEFWGLVRSMADDLSLVRTGPTRVAGHEAAFPMEAHTHVGGTHVVVDIIDTMTFDDEARITSMRAYWDATEMRLVED